MHFIRNIGAPVALVCGVAQATSREWSFVADDAVVFESSALPVQYSLSESQLAQGLGSSFWTSSYVTGSNEHQYLILSHVLLSKYSGTATNTSITRFSVLDLTEPDDNYWAFTTAVTAPNTTLDTKLALNFEHVTFDGISSDSVSVMHTTGQTDGISYDITWESSSAVIYNGGTGTFSFGPLPANQWSMPAGKTNGSLTLNGTEVLFDTTNSFTWYDRQWQDSSPTLGNWTWFELHFQDPLIKASIWAIDENTEPKNTSRFASVRTPDGTHVLTYTLSPDYSTTWYSSCSNETYPLAWTLEFQNGEKLVAKSIRPDQELCGEVQIAYEGFVEVTGTVLGNEAAYGLVEIVDTRVSI
ncbi:Kievitone hydratase [Neofusicoccum parvum]|nr:Kievitone hydratase [Neofusicoccum parvum]